MWCSAHFLHTVEWLRGLLDFRKTGFQFVAFSTDRLTNSRKIKKILIYCFPNFILVFEIIISALRKCFSLQLCWFGSRAILVWILVLVQRAVCKLKPFRSWGKTWWVYFWMLRGFVGLIREVSFKLEAQVDSRDFCHYAITSLFIFKD